jgi:DDE superfamily endonuclease
MDEHRIGLKPILRRTWSIRGQRPIVAVHQRYEWLYVYGFVHPLSGRTFWLLMPTVSIPAFNAALQAFAQHVSATQHKRIFLLVDRAGWHTSPQIERLPGLNLLYLPPYSPELQPAEHLWALSDGPLANRCFRSLDELEAVQAERCNWLQDRPDLVRSATLFHWWPRLA